VTSGGIQAHLKSMLDFEDDDDDTNHDPALFEDDDDDKAFLVVLQKLVAQAGARSRVELVALKAFAFEAASDAQSSRLNLSRHKSLLPLVWREGHNVPDLHTVPVAPFC
jgi:hypothetical protein